MPMVHLVEGPVGAGKSTFSKSLARDTNGVHIALDEWFVKLFSPDRPAVDFIPWYVSRKARLLELIWAHSHGILAVGSDVVLELGLIQQKSRIDFCRMVISENFHLVMYELDAPIEVRRARVSKRNIEKGATFSMIVPEQIFELVSSMWEPSDEFERSEYEVKYVSTVANYAIDG